MTTHRRAAHINLLLLALIAGGCASADHGQATKSEPSKTMATTPVAAASTSGSSPKAPIAAAPAKPSKASSPAPASTAKYTAIIDGKEVPCPDIPMGDDATIQRILEEGKNQSQVMDHLRYLTSQIGPRLTGSSNAFTANQWCMAQYQKWGLSNAHLEQWGTIGAAFDRGPSTGKLYIKRDARAGGFGPGGRNRPGGATGAGGNGAAASERPGAAIKPADADKPTPAPDSQSAKAEAVAREAVEKVNAAKAELQRAQGISPAPAPADAKPADNADAKPDQPSDEPKFTYDVLRDFQFTTMSWTAGTNGPVRGLVVKEPKTEEDFEKVKDKLKGAWVLLDPRMPTGQRGFRSQPALWYDLRDRARRKAAGTETAEAPAADAPKAADTDKADASKSDSDSAPKPLTVQERIALEPVAGYISASRNDLVITSGVPKWRDLDVDKMQHDVHVLVTRADYDAMNSRLADGEEVFAEFDLHHTFIKGPAPTYNTIAEIPGSKYPDEVVIVSGHLDSWDGPGSQGAGDNGTGTVVTLEAARILMAAHAKPLRTIRFIDWTGEEQGLLGSKAYVEAHKSEMDKISAVLVDDGGTNSEGGLTVADQMVEMMAAATAPTNNQFYDEVDKRYLNVNIKAGGEKIRTHGASDHASFNAVHVPGFFWDEVGRDDYNHIHHTQFDRIDDAVPSYLVQSATNAAITAYRLACAPSLLPREVVPPPAPPKEDKKDDKQASAGN
jgi:hypothetical protein